MVDEVFAGRSSKKYSESKLLKDVQNKQEFYPDRILQFAPNSSIVGDTSSIISAKTKNGLLSKIPTATFGGGKVLGDPAQGQTRHSSMSAKMPNIEDALSGLDFISQAAENKYLQNADHNRLRELFNDTSNIVDSNPTRENPLLNFEPYNYILTLSCISPTALENGSYIGGSYKGTVIAQSGGKGRQGSDNLSKDFYFSGMTLRTVITGSSESPNTNAYQINCSIEEPFGLDLVPALIQAARQQGYDNHMMAVYLISIEFVGYDDNGNPQSIGGPKTDRYIPIQIFELEFTADAAGGTYDFIAAPYNYLVKTYAYDELPFQITCYGTTVKTILTTFFENLNKKHEKFVDKGKINIPNKYSLSEFSRAEILESKLLFDKPGSTDRQTINVQIQDIEAGGSSPHSGIQPAEGMRKIVVRSGESIIKFIRYILDHSEFFLNRVDESQRANSQTIPIPNIMTSTKILAQNNGPGDQAYEFVFQLAKQERDKSFVEGEAPAANAAPDRIYNYIYTGENKQVLSFDVKYNFAYFQAVPYFNSDGSRDANDDKQEPELKKVEDEGVKDKQTRAFPGGHPGRETGYNPAPDEEGQNQEVADIFREILEDPSADMIISTMEILGDPHWIEQKTTQPPRPVSRDGAYEEADGSVSPDTNEPLVRVNVRLPNDIDDQTGFYQLEDSAFFEGNFMPYICESRFEAGVFTQLLTMVRQHNQQGDEILPKNSSSNIFNPKIYDEVHHPIYGSDGNFETVHPIYGSDAQQKNVQYGPKNVFSTASLPIPVKKPVLPDSAGIDLTSSVGKRRLGRRT